MWQNHFNERLLSLYFFLPCCRHVHLSVVRVLQFISGLIDSSNIFRVVNNFCNAIIKRVSGSSAGSSVTTSASQSMYSSIVILAEICSNNTWNPVLISSFASWVIFNVKSTFLQELQWFLGLCSSMLFAVT